MVDQRYRNVIFIVCFGDLFYLHHEESMWLVSQLVVCFYMLHLISVKKVKGRFLELLNTAVIIGLLYSYSQQVPTFISRGTTHTDARDLYQQRRELLPMNFASKFVIYRNLLGSFTCCKAGTWDRFFYFPSEGRHTEDFPDRFKPGRSRVWTCELGFQWPVC